MNVQSALSSKLNLPWYKDLTKDEDQYGFRPSTKVIAQQLNAINEHNLALPPRKKAKESLPEIAAPNVYAVPYIKKDEKKGTKQMGYKHFNIGLIDESTQHNPDLPKNSSEAFSITNHTRGL